MAVFWPNTDEERARHALNQALHVLRQELGAAVVETRGDEEVRVAREGLWCDAVSFEEVLGRELTEEALALYGGDLLSGFHLSGCPEFERWLDVERSRLRTRAVEAALERAQEVGRGGSGTDAVHWARRALEWAPYEEGALRRLLDLLDQMGDRAGAIQEYDAFATRLRQDLEVVPSPETQAAVEAIRGRKRLFESLSGTPIHQEAEEAKRVEPDESASGSAWATRRFALSAVAAVAALVIVAAAVLTVGTGSGSSLRDERLVVAPFENRTGDQSLDAVGYLAAEWIAQGLMFTGLLEVVSSTDALRTAQVLARERNGLSSAGLAWALANETGARVLVAGSYHGSSEEMVFDAQVTDVSTGQLLRGVEGVAGPLDNIEGTVEILRQRVLGALATLLDERLASWSDASSQPPSFQAYQLYADGLDLFLQHSTNLPRDSLFTEAAYCFREAAALDTTFTAPLIWAVFALANAGRDSDADEIRNRLASMRDRLAPWDRAMTDYLSASASRDRMATLRAARKVAELVPDSDWLYKLGQSALRANRPQEAVDALERIDPTRGWMKEWISYWAVLMNARHALGDCQRELEDSERARSQHGPALWYGGARALACLGRGEETVKLAEGAMAQARRPMVVLSQVSQLYDHLKAHDQDEAADSLNKQIRAWYRSLPQEEREGFRARYVYARSWTRSGHPDSARLIYRSLLADSANPVNATYRETITCDLGILAARRGDREAVLRLTAAMEPPTALCQAMIAAELGDRDQAVTLLRDTIAHGFSGFSYLRASPSLLSLRGYPPFEEMVRPKG
jgi:DNA-binding SARP family transcriptional activator